MIDYIVAINRGLRFALTRDDRIAPLTNLKDADGDETDDIDEAVTAVARVSAGIWVVIRLDDYPVQELN